MKKLLLIFMLFTIPLLAQTQSLGEGSYFTKNLWKLAGTVVSPASTAWTLTLPATTFSPSIVTPLIIGGADTISTLTYKTTTGVGKTGARHIFQVGNNGGTEAMTILNDGKVGIGIASPGAKLDVYSTTNPEIRISNGGGTSPNPTLTLFRQAGVSANINYDVANKNLIIQNDYSTVDTLGNIYFNTRGANTKVTIKGDGDLGIGTTTPLHKLSGYSTTATNLNAFNFVNNTINKVTSTVAQAIDTSSFSLNFSSLGSPKLSLKGKTGNSMIYVDSVGVGIGTASPAAKLDINDGGKIILNAGVNPELTIGNNTATNSTTGTASLVFLQANTAAGGKIVSGRDDIYLTGASRISNLQFYTSSNAANTEKMRITNIGNLGLGTTTPYAQYSQVGATPIWYATDSDFNLHRTSLAFATDTSAIKIDASVTEPTITVKNTIGNGFALSTVTAGGASFDGGLTIAGKLTQTNQSAIAGTITSDYSVVYPYDDGSNVKVMALLDDAGAETTTQIATANMWGEPSGGAILNGTTQYYSHANNANLNFGTGNFTLVMNIFAITLANIPSNDAFYFRHATTGIIVEAISGGANLKIDIGAVSVSTSTFASLGMEGGAYLILVRNGGDVLIYVNGVYKATYSGYSGANASPTGSFVATFGSRGTGTGYMNMTLGTIGFYNYALTQAEVSRRWNNGQPHFYVEPYATKGANNDMVATYDSSATHDSTITLTTRKDYYWVKGSADSISVGTTKYTASTKIAYVSGTVRAKGDLTGSTLKLAGETFSIANTDWGASGAVCTIGGTKSIANSTAYPIAVSGKYDARKTIAANYEFTGTAKVGSILKYVKITNTVADIDTVSLGTTGGGFEVLNAQVIGASSTVIANVAKWFSDSATQTLYLHATHWASDNLEVVLIYEPIGEKL